MGVIIIKLLDLEINEKIYKRILIIGIFLICCYVMIYFLSITIPRIYIMDSKTKIAQDEEITAEISTLVRGKFKLKIDGYAYRNGESVDSFNSKYILKSRKDGRMYILQTGMKEVPYLLSVDGIYNCKYSGLYTNSIILGLKNGDYDLYILYKNNDDNVLVNTGVLVEI